MVGDQRILAGAAQLLAGFRLLADGGIDRVTVAANATTCGSSSPSLTPEDITIPSASSRARREPSFR
jgi:hypothetical protein